MYIINFKINFSFINIDEYKYYHHCLACLKQQRSLVFPSCKSVETFSPGVSWALKCALLILKIIFDL